MLTHHYPTNFKQQLPNDHDLTELSWLTRSDMFDQRSSNSVRQLPKLSQSLPAYVTDKEDIPRHHHSSPSSLIDSSDSEHDNDSSSLNSSSERVTTVNLTDIVSPPHSALCFWILFAIEESKTRSLTLNEICDWIERHIEQQQQLKTTNPTSSDEQLIRSARLKSKIRYHMTKQISFFVKIIKDPVSGIKLRYPLWATDRSKRQLLLDTLLTMNTRQLSLYTQYTIDIYERLCSERRLTLTRNTNDENSCPTLSKHNTKRDKTIHRLGSSEESNNNKRKKQYSKNDSSTTSIPSVEVVDAAMTLLLLRKPK
ncbi:unnamed protein product [Rotaria sp. Silwood2]|nr:unnamed protein product [Rotaria sp. Silwood2]CAF3040889.1 unnamed protein product [Rotaria sp. Silwood2]CAF3983013.1 unnamed protein product [Rotaria sp. Silwood2]CAF4690177.1 unnamed protein product [Rotaria sp. Silwood2]